MTALAADKQLQSRPAKISLYPCEEDTIFYKGALVCLNANGYAVPASKTAGLSEVIGHVSAYVSNSGGADGAKSVSVESGEIVYPVVVSGAQALVGNNAFVIDDATVGGVASAGVTALSPIAGRFVEYISATKMGVYIPIQERRTEVEVGLVAGGAAGAHTLTGINLGDKILWVGHFTTAAAIATLADLTAEFSITAANTIDNTGGTDTTNDQLMVIYEKRG